jgi:hypothetical protein|tara:strand:+ start:763 stop:1608 length:846 start_codon:yes stop_codon:yes gene_type:complete
MDSKEKVLVVVPTTASRLSILKEVLDSVYSNEDKFDITTVIVKNGTFPNEDYYNYDLEYDVIKTESHPGGNLPAAFNKSLEYLTEEFDWWLYQEDDLIIKNENWMEHAISTYKSIDKCGAMGIRLHGGMRRYNPQKEYTIESLKTIDNDTFEVYWSDGIMLIKKELFDKEDLKFDEDIVTAATTDMPFQLIEKGYENWRVELQYTHHHITGDRIGTPKWKWAEGHINMEDTNRRLYLKYQNTKNSKLKEWVEMDGAPAGTWLKERDLTDKDYRTFRSDDWD